MRKRLSSILLVFLFVFTAVTGFQSTGANAAETGIKVDVVVLTNEKVLVQGQSEKLTVVDAIEDVLAQNGITPSKPKGYIEEVVGLIGGKTLSPNSGWMYEVNRGGTYADSPWDAGFTFKPGDRVVFYFGDYMVTQKADKIVYSTTLPNTKLAISIENKFTGPISGIKAKVYKSDDKNNVYFDNVLADNKVNIEAGLPEGTYTLELSDYKSGNFPKVIADSFNFVVSPVVTNNTSSDPYERDNSLVKKDIEAELTSTLSYISRNQAEEPWSILSVSKLGIKSDTAYLKAVAAQIKKDKGLKELSNTELEKLIILSTASGFTANDFVGHNLVEELYSRDLGKFLINDAIYGLIAMDYANVSDKHNITREKLVNYILNKKISYEQDGQKITGWSLGSKIDVDITGLAINALSAQYDTNSQVKESVNAAVESLSKLQNSSGYVKDSFGYSSESLSVVILGLTSVGINPEGGLFQKSKGDLVSALLSFKGTEGQYKHNLDGSNNLIATEQVLRALIALKEYKASGKYNYFKNDVDSSKLSKFTISDKELLELGILPQTGSAFDTNVLFGFGVLLIIGGVLLARNKRVTVK
jgi:LPXTG-motif cell wall-anchored protein